MKMKKDKLYTLKDLKEDIDKYQKQIKSLNKKLKKSQNLLSLIISKKSSI